MQSHAVVVNSKKQDMGEVVQFQEKLRGLAWK